VSRATKKNYGYELRRLFGEKQPKVSAALPPNMMVNILQKSGKTRRQIRQILPPQYSQYVPKRLVANTKVNNPIAKAYRAKRKIPFMYNYMNYHYINNKNPKAFLNTQWKFYSLPIGGRDLILFYNSRNSEPFLIDKKSGRRKAVRPSQIAEGRGYLRNRNSGNTWNAFRQRSQQRAKHSVSFQRANNYATGRTNKAPSNSTMRFYFEYHPRPRQMGANTVENIRREIKNSIQTNLMENLTIPNRNNLQNEFQNLTNRSKVRNMNELVKKMREYRNKAGNTMTQWNRRTFDILLQSAINRNKMGVYYR
jgi:hypothetical protein